MPVRALLSLAALLVLPLACVDAPQKVDDNAQQDRQQQDQKPDKAPPSAKPKPGSNELSAEELELIDSDPETLTPEQNRKRAFALRKKIMQNPDSPQAQALEDARAAALSGEMTPPGQVAPKPNSESGLVIELPEHLKDQDVTHAPPQK